ncbi:MAG: hypothetical protein IJL26_05775 [Clostridia bacterium]|nr:hypothetical protein [Clostridia bacterium]
MKKDLLTLFFCIYYNTCFCIIVIKKELFAKKLKNLNILPPENGAEKQPLGEKVLILSAGWTIIYKLYHSLRINKGALP